MNLNRTPTYNQFSLIFYLQYRVITQNVLHYSALHRQYHKYSYSSIWSV